MKSETILYILMVLCTIGLYILTWKAFTNSNEPQKIDRNSISINYLVEKNIKLDSLLVNSKVILKSKDTLEILGVRLRSGNVILENGVEYNYNYLKTKFTDSTITRKLNNL